MGYSKLVYQKQLQKAFLLFSLAVCDYKQLHTRFVISQACQNVVAEVCMLFRKKYISSMTTYFAQHQLCLQLQLKALDYTCFDCIQGINQKEITVSHGSAQSFIVQAVFTDNNSILSQKFCSSRLEIIHASHGNVST